MSNGFVECRKRKWVYTFIYFYAFFDYSSEKTIVEFNNISFYCKIRLIYFLILDQILGIENLLFNTE